MALLICAVGVALAPTAAAAPPGVTQVQLSATPSNCTPTAVVDGAGALVAYAQDAPGGSVVEVRRWSPNGGWGDPSAVSPVIADCMYLSVASDGSLAAASWMALLSDKSLVIQGVARPTAGSAWQAPATVLTLTEDQQDGKDQEFPWFFRGATVSGGVAALGWSTMVYPEDIGTQAMTSVWSGRSWSPPYAITPIDPSLRVVLHGFAAAPEGPVALLVRGSQAQAQSELAVALGSKSPAADQVLFAGTAGCTGVTPLTSGPRLLVIAECYATPQDTGSRVMVQERVSGQWGQFQSLTEPRASNRITWFPSVAASDELVAVTSIVRNAKGSRILVHRSTSPGQWQAPVLAGTTKDKELWGADVAARGPDAVVLWNRQDRWTKPGAKPYPERLVGAIVGSSGTVTQTTVIGRAMSVSVEPAASVVGVAAAGERWTRTGDPPPSEAPLRVLTWTASAGWSSTIALMPPETEDGVIVVSGSNAVLAWPSKQGQYAASIPLG